MSQKILVKITKCSDRKFWYVNCIDAMFECYEEDGHLLVASDKDNPHSPRVRMIDKNDCLTRVAEQRDAPVHAAIELLVRIKDKVLTDENYDADEIVREVNAVLNMAAGG